MDFSASAATKDAVRFWRRRSCTLPRFSSTLPVGGVLVRRPILVSSRNNHAFAIFQSRWTVSGIDHSVRATVSASRAPRWSRATADAIREDR
jgi:hypothetical protein